MIKKKKQLCRIGKRKCYICGNVYLLNKENFKKNKHQPRGFSYECKKCDKERDRGNSRILRRQEKIAGRKKPERCEICGSTENVCFDHDHETGEFRGWICHKCNSVLGYMKDSKELLIKMVDYLKKTNGSAGI